MAFTASEIIQTHTCKRSREATKSPAAEQTEDAAPSSPEESGFVFAVSSSGLSPGMLWGRGSALSQAQGQPGPGKVIRGDKAPCTHRLFGIQADPGVSSWAAFTGAEPEPELMNLGWFLLTQPGPAATSPARPGATPEPRTDCTQQGIAAFLLWTPCCKQ